MIGLANPLRVYFWMLGQDARLGLLTQGGFQRVDSSLYRRGNLWLHQLGLCLPDEGLLYSRADCRFYSVPLGTVPPEIPEGSVPLPFPRAWRRLKPHLADYESWLSAHRPDHRRRLLRICPPLLRPMRKKWRQAFL